MDVCKAIAIFSDLPVPVVADYALGKNARLPFAVLSYLENADISADNVNWVPRVRWQLDLYTEKRDRELETAIERALGNRGLFFSKEGEVGNDADYSSRTANYVRAIYRFTTIGE